MVHQLNLDFNKVLEPRAFTDYIILHHSGVKARHSATDIHQWHKNKRWAGIGYHYLSVKKGSSTSAVSVTPLAPMAIL